MLFPLPHFGAPVLGQIGELKTSNSADASVIHHWSFDEDDVSGADATDLIGGNTATIIQSDEDAEFVSTDGKFGGYFHEPDNFDQAELTDNISFADDQAWTVALWVNRRGSNHHAYAPGCCEYKKPRIITPIGSNTSNFEQIELRRVIMVDGKWVYDAPFVWIGRDGNIVRGPIGSGLMPAEDWVHIAVVSDGESVTLYRDGDALTTQVPAGGDTGWTFNSIGKGKI